MTRTGARSKHASHTPFHIFFGLDTCSPGTVFFNFPRELYQL